MRASDDCNQRPGGGSEEWLANRLPFRRGCFLNATAATSVPNRVALQADARLGRRTGGGLKSRGEYFSRILG